MPKNFKIIYTTDPLCSFCWALEPQLTKLLYHYEPHLDLEIRMGGLFLEDAPADIHQLRAGLKRVSLKYQMPIAYNQATLNWAKHSLLACQLYLIVKKYQPEKANKLLRKMRETQMLFNQDISSRTTLETLLKKEKLSLDYLQQLDTPASKQLLYQDFGVNRVLQADLYPTLSIIYQNGYGKKLSGYVPFEEMETVLKTFDPLITAQPLKNLEDYLQDQDLILFSEIEQVYSLGPEETENFVANTRPIHSEVISILSSKALKSVD